MSSRRTLGPLGVAVVGLLLALVACHRSAPRGIESIAVLPFDNLTPDRDYDWLSAAGQNLLDYQLFGQKNLACFTAPTVNEAAAKHATAYLYTRFRLDAGKLVLDAAVENAGSHRITMHRSFRADASPEGALAAINQLARFIAPGARRVPVGTPAALVPYGTALLGGDAATQAGLLRDALALAPDFMPAWLARITLNVESHAPGAFDDIAIASHSADLLDGARLRVLSAALSGNAAAQIAALSELTRLAPAQSSAWTSLAQLQVNARRFPAAAASWAAVTRLEPWNSTAWNQLGYCRAWAHDGNGATSALAEYARLEPENPNPLDSLGEVQFFLGRYHDAEASFLLAQQKDPAFFDGIDQIKAAEARLMTGDHDGADKLFAQFVEWRRNTLHDPAVPLWKARWQFLTGRRREAMAALASALAQLNGDDRASAEAQYAFWLLATGDRAGARTHAQTALRAAQTPGLRGVALACGFIAMPPATVGEWATRANSIFGTQPEKFREAALGYALVLDGHAAEAIALLERVYAASTPGDDAEQRAMLAAALFAAGRHDEAKKLLWPMPIPLTSDESTFSALVFPRWLAWSGDPARFRQYSGDLRLVFE